MNLPQLNAYLQGLRGVGHKLDIQKVAPAIGTSAVPVGDDCAAIPDGDGYLLFAIEGLLDEFVAAEPWFAGYCSVMVNVSDICAMGGRPTAVVDAIWAASAEKAGPIWDGMHTAATKYGVPIVGGHTNHRSAGDHLAVAIVGRARKLLTSFDARPGDALVVAIDLRGEWYGPYPYWNASTTVPGDRLRGDLELLPMIAEAGLAVAAKDISMGGVVGTTTMLAECSGVGVTIDVSRIPMAEGALREKWLSAFPSFGFVLAVPQASVAAVVDRFSGRGIAAAAVGTFDDSRTVRLADGAGPSELFWDLRRKPFIGFGPAA
ncbi:sll0787 family AIR synthase-like protein [Humisphaera borealis]|uniref:Sll0787 family AIR synthase-like protein n=1 Tax=Humisphaera borealis TaxID=2807512 RepID=A0A7M2WVU8_9BACT|nr:sll0787 family AIR synthase-like protein [Humisphaera borealis]QOV89677.1 sll0787 family AIR synthase-like protein [Humisphaera borealis]